MPFGLGFGETLLILAVILLFFGPKRLPDAAASLGRGIREFKRAVNGIGEELSAPSNAVAAAPVAPPPHATLPGTGADPNAIAAPSPLAAALASESEAVPVAAAPAAHEPEAHAQA